MLEYHLLGIIRVAHHVHVITHKREESLLNGIEYIGVNVKKRVRVRAFARARVCVCDD